MARLRGLSERRVCFVDGQEPMTANHLGVHGSHSGLRLAEIFACGLRMTRKGGRVGDTLWSATQAKLWMVLGSSVQFEVPERLGVFAVIGKLLRGLFRPVPDHVLELELTDLGRVRL